MVPKVVQERAPYDVCEFDRDSVANLARHSIQASGELEVIIEGLDRRRFPDRNRPVLRWMAKPAI